MSPYFIVGTGRCGTTILAQVLNAHSKICAPPELQIVKKFYDIFSECLNLNMYKEDFVNTINSIHLPYNYNFNFSFEDFFESYNYPVSSLRKLLRDLFQNILKNNNKDILIKQVPWYGLHLKMIKELFPDTKIIHLIRDGRDVSLSFLRTKWWTNSPIDNLTKWCDDIIKIDRDLKIYFGGKYIKIKYEHLVMQPVYTLTIILKFLGFNFENTMLDPKNLIDFGKNKKPWRKNISSDSFLEWEENKHTVFFNSNVFGWKKEHQETFSNLTDYQRSTLTNFGYSLCQKI